MKIERKTLTVELVSETYRRLDEYSKVFKWPKRLIVSTALLIWMNK